jgi:hypothetical protein
MSTTYPSTTFPTRYRRTNRMTTTHYVLRSTEMHTMHEALAREHIRQLHADAQHRRLVDNLAAAKRWRKREVRAHAAYVRHVNRAAVAS